MFKVNPGMLFETSVLRSAAAAQQQRLPLLAAATVGNAVLLAACKAAVLELCRVHLTACYTNALETHLGSGTLFVPFALNVLLATEALLPACQLQYFLSFTCSGDADHKPKRRQIVNQADHAA